MALSIPPPSQSSIAIGLVGSAVMRTQIFTIPAIAASQSSDGSVGSLPLSHSVALSIPPLSQSAVANELIGKLAMCAQIFTLFAMAQSQSHCESIESSIHEASLGIGHKPLIPLVRRPQTSTVPATYVS